MKICFCIGKLKFSGAENVMRYLIENLIDRGHDVSVIILEKMPEGSECIEGLVCKNAIVSGSGILNALKRVKAQRKALKELKPDVFVIFNYTMAFTAIPATFFMKGIKVVACERNAPEVVPGSNLRRKIRDFLFSFADACVSQTDVIKKYFERITKKNYVIPNPVRDIKPEMCSDVSERNKVFVTTARLDDNQKNQTMMINAFANVAQNHPEYELHFLGDGPDLCKYQELVKKLNLENRIKFLGNSSNPIGYMKNCRAFLLTSNFEGMPNALMEAMSIGLPCVSTDCLGGGAAALINDSINGFLVNRDDLKTFSEKLALLAEDDELCKSIGCNAYNINQELAGERILNMWETLFNELLGRSEEL